MNRTPVTSSQIASVGYSSEDKILELEFLGWNQKPNTVYSYANVPTEVHKALMDAPSIGKYFGQNIKGNAMYPHTKLS